MADRENGGSAVRFRRAGLNKPTCRKGLDWVKLLGWKGWRRRDFREDSVAVLGWHPAFQEKNYVMYKFIINYTGTKNVEHRVHMS